MTKLLLGTYLAPVRNSHKGERKAKLDDIRRIGHLLTNFRKISLFSVALNMDPKKALNLKKMHRPTPFKGRSELAF